VPKLEEALFDYLTSDAGVSALVDERVYPVRLPERSLIPAISWSRVSANRIYTYSTFEDTDAWVAARIQFNCWDYTAMGSMELGEAVLKALSGYYGEFIGSSFAINELDIYEAPTKFHRRILDFLISYEDDLVVGS
jgi:hypothetical protein